MNEVSKKEFNHLKIHTQYSICEGALRVADLAKHCKTNKVKAVGICDSHNLCGALEFSENLSKVGTQPIVGTQIVFNFKNQFGLIPLIAKNEIGYKKIIELSSKSYLENKNLTEPHCNFDDLLEKAEGIIILSGHINGLIGKLFNNGKRNGHNFRKK